MTSTRRLFRKNDVISLSSSEPESEDDSVQGIPSSSVQVPSSSPFKDENRPETKKLQLKRPSQNNKKSVNDSDMDSSPIRGSQAPRLASLTEKFSYKPRETSLLNSRKGNRISGIESAKNLKILRAKFPHVNPAELLSSLKISSSVSSAIDRVRRDLKNRKNKAIRIDDDSDDGNNSDSEPKIRLDSSPSKEIDVVSSKVTLEKHGRLVDRYRKKAGDSPHKKRRHYSSDPEPEEIVVSDSSDDPLATAFQKAKKRKLKRGTREISKSFIREITDVGNDDTDYIASRSKRFTRKAVVELNSESPEEDEEDEEDEDQSDDSADEPKVKSKVLLKRVISNKRISPLKDKVEQIELSDEPGSDESGDEFSDSEDDDLDMDQKTLKFLNNADIRDIVDIAGITPSIAKQFIDKRPYQFLEDIEESSFEDPNKKSKNKRPANRKSIGEKIVETTLTKLKGYEAVNSLIRKCHDYGRTITKEIKKWGVTIEGDGELEVAEVKVSTNESESEDSIEEINSDDESHTTKITDKNNKIVAVDDSDSDNSDDEDFYNTKQQAKANNKTDSFSTLKKFNHQPTGYFKKKPKLLSKDVELKGYQQVGVNWLNLLYQKNLSCILADEMGLGKTFQVIAFLSHLKEKKIPGPHLIVVPSSTLENWLREFEKFSPSLDVRPYYGTQAEREDLRYELETDTSYDVLVTTYNLATGSKYDLSFLRSRRFNVIVYDEGHMLKNSYSERYVKLMRLRAHFRLLLTGTPLQNNLRELVSLLSFILPSVFNDRKEDFQVIFDQKASTRTSSKEEFSEEDQNFNPLLSQQAIKKAKTMMAPFVLRRKKDQVMRHLPAKHQEIVICKMTPLQKRIYKSQFVKADEARQERERRKKLSTEEIKLLPKVKSTSNVLMYLRKAAIHPLLFRTFYDEPKLRSMAKAIMRAPQYIDANEQYIFEDMTVMTDFELNDLCHNFSRELGSYYMEPKAYLKSGKVQKMMEIIDQVLERKEKVLVFSLFTQVLDILEKVLSMNQMKFVRLDGGTSVEERQNIIDTFYSDEDIPVFLLSTKAGGFGINLVAANNVIIFDQSFNPHDDKQAEDRAHRVGQTKEVHVYRLICEKTIEQNILQLAYEKLQLDSTMMNEATAFNEDNTTKFIEDVIFSKEGSATANGKNVDEDEDADEIQEDEIKFENPDFVPPPPLAVSVADHPIESVKGTGTPIEVSDGTPEPAASDLFSGGVPLDNGLKLVMETIDHFVKVQPESTTVAVKATKPGVPNNAATPTESEPASISLFVKQDSETPTNENENALSTAATSTTSSSPATAQSTISRFFRRQQPAVKKGEADDSGSKETAIVLSDSDEEMEEDDEKEGSVYEDEDMEQL